MLDIRQIARELLSAQERGGTITPLSARDPAFDLDAAYAVAAEAARLRQQQGLTPVGRKIGFTNRSIWPELGLNTPIWAYIYDRTVRHAADGPAAIPLARLASPKIEPELVFKLRAPLDAQEDDPAAILAAAEWIAPGFEIVDCHFPGWRMRSADAVADFGLHAVLLIGGPLPSAGLRPEQIRDMQVSLYKDGEKVAQGGGTDVLGSPLLALAHLAGVLDQQGKPLAAGELVTTGTLTAALPVTAGETWRMEVSGLQLAPLEAVFS